MRVVFPWHRSALLAGGSRAFEGSRLGRSKTIFFFPPRRAIRRRSFSAVWSTRCTTGLLIVDIVMTPFHLLIVLGGFAFIWLYPDAATLLASAVIAAQIWKHTKRSPSARESR